MIVRYLFDRQNGTWDSMASTLNGENSLFLQIIILVISVTMRKSTILRQIKSA